MTEAILNNILQTGNQDFSSPSKKSRKSSSKSFSETMQKIKQTPQKTKKESASISDRKFLAKLKKILKKNNKEVPQELLSLLQGGSLNTQQQSILEKLMLNLENNNLDLSKLRSLLGKNSSDLKVGNLKVENPKDENSSKIEQIFSSEDKVANKNTENLNLESLKLEDLRKLTSLLENKDQPLTEAENSKLKTEVDQLVKFLMNSNSEGTNKVQKNLEQILGTENLEAKLTELTSVLNESGFSFKDFAKITETKEVQLPLLNQALSSEGLDFSGLSEASNSETNSSLYSELAAQIKEMLSEEKNTLSNQNQKTDFNLSNSNLFSLNSDSTLDLALEGGNLENKNQSNFFDLDNSNLFFNLDLENQNTANNLNVENFSLNNNNAKLAENADLRTQVVEQFRGEYSPETKEMQVQLKPESLGKIDISLSYDNEQLTGKMLVESELVRAQLENSLKGLKSDLLKQGINIEQFKIETAKNSPQQVENKDEFAFNDQDSASSDGETGQNQEYEQRQFFQGQYYVQRNNEGSNLEHENIIMRQQEIINRAAFSNEKLDLLA